MGTVVHRFRPAKTAAGYRGSSGNLVRRPEPAEDGLLRITENASRAAEEMRMGHKQGDRWLAVTQKHVLRGVMAR